jgi:phage gpG-like protein
MIVVNAQVVGVARVTSKLREMPARIQQFVSAAVKQSGIEVQRGVMSNRLSGQVLNVVTGRLRRSITHQFSDQQGYTIRSRVGTNVEYAARFELGFHGTETVSGHWRKIYRHSASGRRGRQTQAAWVRDHTRRANQPARSFLRSEFDSQRDAIMRRLEHAVTGGSGWL